MIHATKWIIWWKVWNFFECLFSLKKCRGVGWGRRSEILLHVKTHGTISIFWSFQGRFKQIRLRTLTGGMDKIKSKDLNACNAIKLILSSILQSNFHQNAEIFRGVKFLFWVKSKKFLNFVHVKKLFACLFNKAIFGIFLFFYCLVGMWNRKRYRHSK